MKFTFSVGLIVSLVVRCAKAENIADTIEVTYRPEIVLGEKSTIMILEPENVFYQLFEIYYAPNGTSRISEGRGNTPLRAYFDRDRPQNSTATCTRQGSGGVRSTQETHVPNSAGDGWGYAVMLKLFYPSNKEFMYVIDEHDGSAGVCIMTPYVVEELVTERRNIKVLPTANGDTIIQDSSVINPPPESGRYVTERWRFKRQPSGPSFEGRYGPTQPVMIALGVYWALLILFALLTFPSLFSEGTPSWFLGRLLEPQRSPEHLL